MTKRRRSTFSGLLTSLISGSLVCSLLGVFGFLLPFSLAGAAALAGLTLILVIKDQRACDMPSQDRDGPGNLNVIEAPYEIAIKISYAGRVSRATGLALLARMASFLTSCDRLSVWIKRIAQVPADAALSCSGADSLPHQATTGRVPATMAGPIGPVLQEVISTVGEMAGVLRDVDHNAKDLITSTEETAYSMTRLDSFLQDMAKSGRDLEASTDTANRVALEGTKVVEEMGRENEAIITTVKEAASAVEDLGRWSQEVGKIVEVIRDIANETNLLALNASIIAAQSGEHGKAFGVVAEEIRGLAERTSSSTKEISDLVKAVQKNVANVVNGMKKSLQRVERGELLTRNAGTVLEKVFESFESSRNLAKQIASSTFEHKIDSSQVVRSLHRVTDIARRLQSHNYGGWTGAGETLSVVRALNAMYDTGNGLGKGFVPMGLSGESHTGSELACPVEASEDGLQALLTACDREIGCCEYLLEKTRDTLDSWLSALDLVSQTAKTSLETVGTERGFPYPGPCWEIAQCDLRLRDQCPAYKNDDRSLFFSREAACMRQEVEGEAEIVKDDTPSPSRFRHTDQIAHKVGS